jgi:tetratricopeptide (TPR) repeat protein
MNKPIVILALLLTAANGLCGAIDVASLERKIEQAFYRGDAAVLTAMNGELAAALETEPQNPQLQYFAGFATYAQACLGYASHDMRAVQTGLEKADALLKAVKGGSWEDEAAGFRGLITGQLIGVRGSSSGMTLGPKMMKLTSAAYEKSPKSGRVLIFHAATLLNTPEMFGGDPDEALKLFQRAIARFAQEHDASSAPTWGQAYAFCWLAQARLKKGDFAGAKTAADQALALEPDYQQVRFGLLPAIEKKAALASK